MGVDPLRHSKYVVSRIWRRGQNAYIGLVKVFLEMPHRSETLYNDPRRPIDVPVYNSPASMPCIVCRTNTEYTAILPECTHHDVKRNRMNQSPGHVWE